MNIKEFDKILKEQYNFLDFKELACLTNRAVNTVQKRIKFLGLVPNYALKYDLKLFKPIIYNGIVYDKYLINIEGVILDLNNRGKTVKCRISNGGYYVFNITFENKLKTLFLHKVIAEVYKPNPNPEIYDTVNHISGIKTDFSLDNLEWTNRKGNTIHAYKTGLMASKVGEKSNFAKYSNTEIEKAKNLLIKYPKMTAREIKTKYDLPMSISYLNAIRSNRRRNLF